jgi:hypothetical protein
VIGSSIVYWAYRTARGRHGGPNLGLHYKGFNLHWLGSRKLKWEGLIPMIEKSLLTQPLPQILIIQLGSNDLGIVKGKELIELIRCDILRICKNMIIPVFMNKYERRQGLSLFLQT